MVIATASFGNMLLAMSPIQTLFQNLIYDFSQLIIAVDYVDDTFISKPQRWTTKDLVPFTLVNGPVSSIFDLINYGISGFAFGIFSGIQTAQNIGDSAKVAQLVGEFQATTFLIGLVTQATIVHVLRTEKIPLVQSRSPWIIYLITGLIVSLAYLIVLTPSIASLLEMNSPRMIFLPTSIAIVISYWITAQFFKVGYKKIFQKWL